MTAITTSTVLDDLKVEGQDEWVAPHLQLVIGSGAFAKGATQRPADEKITMIIPIKGSVSVSF